MMRFSIDCTALLLLLTTWHGTAVDWAAIHRQDDIAWARKTGLTPATVRELRHASGIKDDLPEGRIDNLDPKTLAFRKQFLIVTSAGNGHCLTVTVLRKNGHGPTPIWSASEGPDGSGFCHKELRGDPKAYATPAGSIVVAIPSYMDEEHEKGDAIILLKYGWTGKTYQFAGRTKTTYHPR